MTQVESMSGLNFCLLCGWVVDCQHDCPTTDHIDDLTDTRGEKYGPPHENHQRTADMWTAYLSLKLKPGERITAREVCWMNVYQKGSRDAHSPWEDNILDSQGYLRNAERIDEKERT